MNKPDIFIKGLADPVQAGGTDHQISEIAHGLANCMCILRFWVETLGEVNRDFPDPSVEDLRNLIDKITSLIEELAATASSL